jgi:DNA-binding NtrC family response regulator
VAKILLVDDDDDVRESVGDYLAHDHDVRLAASVPEALVLLEGAMPDVVVVDFEIPPYRGDDLLALIAERHPEVGRFMLTGSPGRALGFAYSIAHRVLRKGCDLRELSRVIREFLVRREVRPIG